MNKRIYKKTLKRKCEAMVFRLVTARTKPEKVAKAIQTIATKYSLTLVNVRPNSLKSLTNMWERLSNKMARNPRIIAKINFKQLKFLYGVAQKLGLEATMDVFQAANRSHALN